MSERELKPKTSCQDCGNAVVFDPEHKDEDWKCLVCDEWREDDEVLQTAQNNISVDLIWELIKIPFKHIRRSI